MYNFANNFIKEFLTYLFITALQKPCFSQVYTILQFGSAR